MKKNFIDHGDYIELNEPIGGIKMIAKNPPRTDRGERPDFNPNQNRLGGFTNWRIPTLENCETIREYIRVNGNVLNFEDGWIKAYSKELGTYSFNLFSGERHEVNRFWPKDLCWVALVVE